MMLLMVLLMRVLSKFVTGFLEGAFTYYGLSQAPDEAR